MKREKLEHAVLGVLFNFPEMAQKRAASLPPELFADAGTRRIYGVIRPRLLAGLPVDTDEISERLSVDDFLLVAKIVSDCVTDASHDSHAKKLRELAHGGAVADAIALSVSKAWTPQMLENELSRLRQAFTADESGGKFVFIDGESLEGKAMPKCKWFVEGILPEGFALLVGRSKAGKSYFALQVLAGIARGEPVLGGMATTQTGVAYISLEDSERQVKDRFTEKLKIHIPGNLLLAFDLPSADRPAAIRAIDELLTSHPGIRVVAIDTLGHIRPPSKRQGGTLYDDDTAFYSLFREIGHRHHALILGLHHTNKLRQFGDVFDTISGSMGCMGAADTAMVLEEPPGQDGFDRILHVRGKDVDRQSIALRAVHDYHWKVAGDAIVLQQTSERQAILEVLRLSAAPLSTSEISKAIGKRDPSTSKLLRRMAKDRLVTCPEYGKWGVNPYHTGGR